MEQSAGLAAPSWSPDGWRALLGRPPPSHRAVGAPASVLFRGWGSEGTRQVTDSTAVGVSYKPTGRKRGILSHMIASDRNMLRVSVTLDPVDVALVDRLAALEGSNRSAELRSMLEQLRPVLRATVEALEGAARARDRFMQAAARVEVLDVASKLAPEVARINTTLLGSLARLEGAAAAEFEPVGDDEDPHPSNHGGHIPLTRGNRNLDWGLDGPPQRWPEPPVTCPECGGDCTLPGPAPYGQIGGVCIDCGWDFLADVDMPRSGSRTTPSPRLRDDDSTS